MTEHEYQYQTSPFRITLGPYGSFDAIASEGVIRPRTKKAKHWAESATARADVEAYAFAFLGRKDWKWDNG